jgi:hypothetical protein
MRGEHALARRALLAAPLAACAPPAPPIAAPRGPPTETIFVLQRAWHTDIGLMASDLGPALASLAADARGVQSLIFGFGERGYLLARSPGLAEMARALLPGAGALMVIGLPFPPDGASAAERVALRIDAAGMAALQQALAASFAQRAGGMEELRRDGAHARYYAAAMRYSAGFTCNTWTATLLRATGLPVDPTGVVFAGQVMAQLRGLAGDDPGRA